MSFITIIECNAMSNEIPLYIVGLDNDKPASELFKVKIGGALDKVQNVIPDIIEAKVSVKSQNPEGSRTHYDATFTVKTSKNQLIYTESDWDILKICDQLIRKLEGELPKHDDKRQRESIRKREY